VHSLCASVTAVYLPFFVFGRVLTRLDYIVICVACGYARNTDALCFMLVSLAPSRHLHIPGPRPKLPLENEIHFISKVLGIGLQVRNSCVNAV